jgi:hypoxanthine phosphoribosyltransferase
MPDLYVSWPEYHQKIEHLAVKIHQSSWEFNQIVCLAKGGLRVGDILARIYDQPLAILATSSYGGSGNQERGSIIFSRDLTMTTANLGSRVLLVDDLVDSGITLQQTLTWLNHRYDSYIDEIKTAVLWYKACSVIAPDFYVDYLVESPWIHQPFETYEKMSPAELAATYLSPTSPDLGYSAPSDLRLV